MDEVRGVEPPATSVWFDLTNGTEHVLGPGAPPPQGSGKGFLWVDLELSEPADAAGLVERGYLLPRVLEDDRSAGEVGWTVDADHLHLALAGGHLDGNTLALDRRHIVISEGVVASVHRGAPGHFDRLRERYRDSFADFAKTHGFLLFEMFGALVDDLHSAGRELGERIDELRLATAQGASDADTGSELLVAVLLVRHVLVRTRDLLMELSSRRFTLVPETTQPYLRDLAGRLDGLVDDLAFSRDVLSEAMRAAPAEVRPPASDPEGGPDTARARRPAPGRPALRFVSLGGFQVLRDGQPVPNGEFGDERARQLLGALLCARRPVRHDELVRWFWRELDAERGRDAVSRAVSELRRVLEPDAEEGSDSSVLLSEPGAYRVELCEGDSWDVEEVLAAASKASEVSDPADRARSLSAALEASAGSVYPEWPYAEWTAELRGECETASTAMRASLAEALLAEDRPSDALAHFDALLDDEPDRESWHRGIMRCHSAAGDRALALRQFHTCRSVLRQSRGVEPSPETQALYLELLKAGSATR